jgi:hypothetical protein
MRAFHACGTYSESAAFVLFREHHIAARPHRIVLKIVRSHRGGAPGFLRELQRAVWSVNPNLPLGKVQAPKDIQVHSMAQTAFAMIMLAITASAALLLALVGVYGMVSYIAAERTYEDAPTPASATINRRLAWLRHMFRL